MTSNVLRFGLSFLVLLASWLGNLPKDAAAQETSTPLRSARRLVLNTAIEPHWVDNDRKLWYRRQSADELSSDVIDEYVIVDTKLGTRQVLASRDALHKSLGVLPPDVARQATQFDASPRRSLETGEDSSISFVNKTEQSIELFWIDAAARVTPYGSIESNQTRDQHTFAGHLWMVKNKAGQTLGYLRVESDPIVAVFNQDQAPLEPDTPRRGNGRRERNAINETLSLSNKDGKPTLLLGDSEFMLQEEASTDGSFEILGRSPDEKSIVVICTDDVQAESVNRIESSPASGGRAKLQSNPYLLPGEAMTSYELSVLDTDGKTQWIPLTEKFDFGRPRIRWIDDHRFTVEKIDRGHQRFRVFEIDTHAHVSKTIIDEKSETFLWTMHGPSIQRTNYLQSSKEMLYASERDGWRHLYLVDLDTGVIKNQITQGDWVVRSIERIDEPNRQIWFTASGMNAGEDPYHIHHYRVNFDGTALVTLTQGNGNHSVAYSTTGELYVNSYSRVDAAPVHELRRSSDGSLVRELEVADTTHLIASGWRAPEVFSAKGRDGDTDIWGFIATPSDFDPSKSYPVIEYIYAGPHDSHVPKSFQSNQWYRSLTELGFIVVRIDGMGTANRSKAFHDVCWQNLRDAGFPDRIAWMRAAAETRPYMDLDRVGIYGTSAGGQNAAGALIFHGDFYKAAAAFCGCHDNRMDKASWNEQWMGYPVGPHYSASSNIDNANKLQGHLFLMVGELDTNVPPESTLRLADALIRADKDFEMLVMPGVGHSDGGAYGQRRMRDFFQRHLQGIEPRAAVTEPSSVPQQTPDASIGIAVPNRAETLRVHFDADRGSLERFYCVTCSPTRINRMREYYAGWTNSLDDLELTDLGHAESATLNELRSDIAQAVVALGNAEAGSRLLSERADFAEPIISLFESRQRVDDLDPMVAAGVCDALVGQIKWSHEAIVTSTDLSVAQRTQLHLAVTELRKHFREWFSFFNEYDPMFTWWVAAPFESAMTELDAYVAAIAPTSTDSLTKIDRVASDEKAATPTFNQVANPNVATPNLTEMLRYLPGTVALLIADYERKLDELSNGASKNESAAKLEIAKSTFDSLLAMNFDSLSRSDRVDWLLFKGELDEQLMKASLPETEKQRPALTQDASDLVGTPVGREVIDIDLRSAMIAYQPDELIRIAESEYDWCRSELVRAANEMGMGDDWRAAVEHVKTMHVEPGEQPSLIRDLAQESIETLEKGDWITIPPVASETYRMIMMTPKRQLVNPFFTGGEVISVSFPTSTMRHTDKLQSLRGNNRMFSRATVHHELIPGHHLQGYMTSRYQPHRARFYTPFWGEGWAVYWEMLLYERGFARTPEERVGFLVWRAHRCARIIFSLSFHLGRMTPLECVDFLVENVGFERNSATAEVRRSIGTDYSPLYQAGYMLGAIQLRKLHEEMVSGGKMTERDFHDRVMRENYMPIELLRAALTDAPLERDFKPSWKFYDE